MSCFALYLLILSPYCLSGPEHSCIICIFSYFPLFLFSLFLFFLFFFFFLALYLLILSPYCLSGPEQTLEIGTSFFLSFTIASIWIIFFCCSLIGNMNYTLHNLSILRRGKNHSEFIHKKSPPVPPEMLDNPFPLINDCCLRGREQTTARRGKGARRIVYLELNSETFNI